MPDTARRFGLSLWPRDQRYQPEPSATASAQYLKYLYDRFKDWRLALAAYNAGEGTVQKLFDRHKTRQLRRHRRASAGGNANVCAPGRGRPASSVKARTSNNFPRRKANHQWLRCSAGFFISTIAPIGESSWLHKSCRVIPHSAGGFLRLISLHEKQKAFLKNSKSWIPVWVRCFWWR